MSDVRLRFAPSPTGPLHIGGVRTALYNYLFAKKMDGKILLRLEDTDQQRYVPQAESHIIESLSWLGIQFDEGPHQGGEYGPYQQSKRKDIYRQKVQQLIDNGSAYYAFDTPEEIDEMRKKEEEAGNHAPKYDHRTRQVMKNSLTLTENEVSELLDKGQPYTLRLKIDPGQTITFHDKIRGEISFQSDELDDKILMKTDGLPTYHLANIIDDYSMKITHVIRGEEWLSSTAHHVLLYRAFGWEDHQPIFAHLPLILKPQGKGKLSKRDGNKFGIPVFPIEWRKEEVFDGFREKGFLPEAVLNFLLMLGWNPGTDQEMFSVSEMIQQFSIDKIGKSGARFDYQKALWFNQQYIKEKSSEMIVELIKDQFPHELEDQKLLAIVDLLKERCNSLSDFREQSSFFFEDVTEYDEKMIRKKWKNDIPEHYDALCQVFTESTFTSPDLKSDLESYLSRHELGYGGVMPMLRIAITGKAKGPDLFAIMELLGKEDVLHRLEKAKPVFHTTTSQQNA